MSGNSNSNSYSSSSSSSSSSSTTLPLLEELSAAASSGSETLSHSDFPPSSILGFPLRAAIESGNEAAARLILTHNASHLSQYSKPDSLYTSNPSESPSQVSRDDQLTFAMEASLRNGMHGLLASIKDAGLETPISSFASAIAAPTEVDRFLGLSTAVDLWGFPSGEAFGDLIEHVLPADAPQCLEFILQQQALEDGAEMEPAYAQTFIGSNSLSDVNRQLLQRIITDGH